jgi:voltage-gated sodium channel
MVTKFSIRITEHRVFQNLIVAAILLNTTALALETDQNLAAQFKSLFVQANIFFSVVFVTEIILKMVAQRGNFFRDGWNIFDFIIVSFTVLPIAGNLSAMRALRVIRLLRLTSAFPSLRRTVETIFRAIPGVSSILIIFVLIYIVASIMGTLMFQDILPEYFGNLVKTAFSLFQIMTLEAWASDIVRPIIEQVPWSSTFFVIFIIATNFILINFFVAVFIEATNSSDNDHSNDLVRLEKKIDLLAKDFTRLQIEHTREKIVSWLEKARRDLEVMEGTDDEGKTARSFLVDEFEQQLDEYDSHFGITSKYGIVDVPDDTEEFEEQLDRLSDDPDNDKTEDTES